MIERKDPRTDWHPPGAWPTWIEADMEKSICVVDGCDRAVLVKMHGLCSMHYQRLMRHGTTDAPIKTIAVCKVDGCNRDLVGSIGKGMCSKHYQRWRKNGTTGAIVEQRWHEDRGTNPDRCTEDGCEKPQKARGLCSMHDSRKRRGKPAAMLCAWCWDVFEPRRGSQRFCSDHCANEKRLDYSRRYTKRWLADNPRPAVETYPAKCLWCRTDFDATRRKFRYCSRDCGLLHRGRGDTPYASQRKKWIAETSDAPFTRDEILDRDQWMCWLCEEPIDPECVYPDAYSPSLDHVVPLSKGGRHAPENVRAAHLTCNIRKGARVLRTPS